MLPFTDNGSVLHYLMKERGKLVPRDDADYSVVCGDISKRSLMVVATTFLMMYKFKLQISDVQTQLLRMCSQISMEMEYLAKLRIALRYLAACEGIIIFRIKLV